jgi:hypothetical protein
LNSNSFEKKWATKWWKRYGKFTCEYGVKKKLSTNMERHISMPFYVKMG